MKILKMAFGVLALSLLIGVSNVGSQEAKKNGFVVTKDYLIPEKVDEYVKSNKAFISLLADQKWADSYTMFRAEPFKVVNVFPIESFGSIDRLGAEFEKISQTIGKEKWQKAIEEMSQNVDHTTVHISMAMTDLSYRSDDGRNTVDFQKPYFSLGEYFYPKPGSEMKFEEIARKMVDYQKKKNSPLSYEMFKIVFGPEVPCYYAIYNAPDRETFDSMKEERIKLLDEEFFDLYQQGLSYLRHMEREEFEYDPQLSYFPQPASEETKPEEK